MEPTDDGPLATILVVDDTPVNLEMIGDALRGRYRVRVAINGRNALAAIEREPDVDLVLLDIMMPELDGYEVLTKLRENPVTRDIPVIFVTALDDDVDEAKGLALGAVDYLTKPVRPPILLARVATHLELKRSRDVLREQNRWLESEVKVRSERATHLQDLSIRALGYLAETRDMETGAHILRTQRYVAELAEQLSSDPGFASLLTAETIDLIVKSAPLHDLGKVGVPDSILRKPGKLDAAEWAVMRTHAKLGADALRKATSQMSDPEASDYLRFAIEIAHHHHEKWDGSGYPDGLRGDQIPIAARLMALADVYDALTSRRVYKDRMALDEARDLIVRESGRHFDPAVVSAFQARAERFGQIALELRDASS